MFDADGQTSLPELLLQGLLIGVLLLVSAMRAAKNPSLS